uniref:Uncharacterized protein n=1 Tax=Melopsittacus undulatus TaxID=13146 RepID=A0A8V5HD53_MELUD
MVDKNIYIVQGEINAVVGAIKRNARWSTHTHLDEERDPLLHSFSYLKEVLNNITGELPLAVRRTLLSGHDILRNTLHFWMVSLFCMLYADYMTGW